VVRRGVTQFIVAAQQPVLQRHHGLEVLNRFGGKACSPAQKIKLLLTEYFKDTTVILVIRVIREDRNLSRSRGVLSPSR
jgi:hypothetical protein